MNTPTNLDDSNPTRVRQYVTLLRDLHATRTAAKGLNVEISLAAAYEILDAVAASDLTMRDKASVIAESLRYGVDMVEAPASTRNMLAEIRVYCKVYRQVSWDIAGARRR